MSKTAIHIWIFFGLFIFNTSLLLAHPRSVPTEGCSHTQERRQALQEHRLQQSLGKPLRSEALGDDQPPISPDDNSDVDDIEVEDTCAIEDECSTPCEELEEAMKADGYEDPYGGTGCYDGEVLICVYEDNFSHEDDDPTATEIVTACIQAHEDAHGHQCTCDENGQGLQKPKNDLQSDENESAALGAEIDCYAKADCADAADPEGCQQVVNEFKKDACTQYKARADTDHTSCK